MSRWTCKWFFLSVILLALVVGGCGGNGNGNQMTDNMDDDDDDTPMMECPAGQTGTYPNCMTPPPPAPAGGHNAVIAGIVNPAVAGDPSMPGPTTKPNRPGSDIDDASVFDVVAGDSGVKPRTTIRIDTGANGPNDLNLDELDKDDMAGTPMKSLEGQFMNQNVDSMLGGFAGSVHEKMTGEGDARTVDTLSVFANIDAAKSQSYASYYDGNANRNGVTGAHASGVLTLNTGTSTGMSSLFSGSKIPTSAGRVVSIPADDPATTGVMENEFMGMFNGVAGTFVCSTAPCRAETDAMSKLTLTGGWMFRPTETDPTKIMLPGVQYDKDYLSFGYWVRTTGEGDDTKYGVGTFFDGSQDFSAALSSLEGSATYSGKAAGMYGKKTLNQYGQAVSGSETSGHFTADANLTARFGGVDIAESKQNQIEGTVTNFMDGDEMISPNWELKLNTTAVDDDISHTTTGTPGNPDGNWVAEFFGNPVNADGTATANVASTVDAENAPTGVAGEFTGHFANGHVIGAFGATKDK